MGALVILISIGCCLAVPAGLAVAAFVGSRKRNKVQHNPQPPEGAGISLLGVQGRE